MAKTEILNHCHYDYEIERIQFMWFVINFLMKEKKDE